MNKTPAEIHADFMTEIYVYLKDKVKKAPDIIEDSNRGRNIRLIGILVELLATELVMLSLKEDVKLSELLLLAQQQLIEMVKVEVKSKVLEVAVDKMEGPSNAIN